MTPLHVGIVGCSAEGAALCYRTLCVEGSAALGPHAHPEVSMHTPSFAAYVACLERHDLPGVAALMLDSAAKLAACGAEFLVCPDNTIHEALPLVEPRSPLPWLHIADVVAAEAVARGYAKVGILGTRWLVDSRVYPDKLDARGVRWQRPSTQARQRVSEIIMNELVYGRIEPASTRDIIAAIEALANESCDAVVLGCTELPLAIDDGNSPLPTLDSTRLLARVALRHASEHCRPGEG